MSVLDATSGQTYSTLSAAILGSSANDVLQVQAGSYVENFPNITHNLTIDAVGGVASLSNPQPLPPNGRAILNVPGDLNVSLSISGLSLSGANNDPSPTNLNGPSNGAGILFEAGNATLTVTDCTIFDNEDGLLIGGADSASLSGANATITDSQIYDNGAPLSSGRYGYDHNIYAGTLTSLTVKDSYIHDALGGHEIKSHALVNVISDNTIADGPTAPSSYSIDLEYGGDDVISGNTIEKGPNSSNQNMIHFGGVTLEPNSSLLISDNTVINDRHSSAVNYLLFNESKDVNNANIAGTITDNTISGILPQYLFQDSAGTPVDVASGNSFACFRAGTGIASVGREIPVEDLQPGDRVVLAEGGTAPVIWIGHREVDCRRHPRPQDVLPVRILAGAFGEGVPARDLVVSPDHAVFTDGALIPVRYLLNGRTVVQEPAGRLTYYHVELPSHAVLLAEGLPCESYLDTGNRGAFANGGAAVMLHPDFALRVWETKSCAPLLRDGARLAAVRRHLLDRAATLGHGLTEDPALRVLVDGRPVAPVIEGAAWRIPLPAGAAGVRLASRRWVPMHTRPEDDDTRALGVAIAAIRVDGVPIRLDDARLSSGWLPPESTWRWTTGDAGLLVAGARALMFDIAMTGTYWKARPRARRTDPACMLRSA